MHPYGSNTKARCAVMHLRGFASTWWRLEEQKLHLDISMVTWELFLDRFRARFLSDHWRQRRADEFHDLRQLSMSVEQYERRFYELKQYAGISHDEGMLVQHFVRGLNAQISGGVRVFQPKTMEVAVEKARLVEENLAMALGGHIGGQMGSTLVSGVVSHGGPVLAAGSSKGHPETSKGEQQQHSQSHQGNRSQNRKFRSWQRNRPDHFVQPAQSMQSAPSRGSFQQSSAPVGSPLKSSGSDLLIFPWSLLEVVFDVMS